MKIQIINPLQLLKDEETLISLPACNVLFKQGGQGAHMYVLKSGQADILKNDRVVEKAHVGSILGEMSMLEGAIRDVTVIATTDCKLVSINRKRYESLIAETPTFLRYLKKVVASRSHFSERLTH